MSRRISTRARVLVVALAAALVGATITGCSASANSGGSNTIRVIAQTGGPGTALADAAATWNKSHKTKVQVDLFDYDPTRQRTVLSFSSGKNTYDVIGLDYSWLQQYVNSGYLVSLNDMAANAASTIDMGDYIKAYVDWGTVDGNQYALPWFGAVYMLYYRTDLLQQAGVSVPTTWEEYAAAAATLKEKTGIAGTTFIGKRDDPLLDEYWSIAWSYGAEITTDGKSSAMDSPQAVQALEVWSKVLKSAPGDALSDDWPAAAAEFSEGKAAMMINFSDTSDALISDTSQVKGKVGFAALPAGPTGKSTPNLGGWALGVSAKSTHQQDAFDFIAWATSAEQQQVGLANGGSANRISVLSDPANQEKFPYFTAALTNYENSIFFPRTVNWVNWEAAMSPPLSAALSGQTSLQQGVTQASQRLDAEIAKEG
ncbi:MAG: extracellular solute-binding protein [Actinomycetia bacterium]|nr:extracellular solute-binding protein [Actinomycetes bacterium]